MDKYATKQEWLTEMNFYILLSNKQACIYIFILNIFFVGCSLKKNCQLCTEDRKVS